MSNQTFWKNVKLGPPQVCWEWLGCKNAAGYGLVKINYRQYRAHRVMYEEWRNTTLEPNDNVCHKCDNPGCVNPYHLFCGTHDDNMKDMVRKGRGPRGRRNGRAKINRDDVIQIRNRHRAGATAKELADEFPISESSINRIIKRQSWRHV